MAYVGINKETLFMVYEPIPIGLYSWSIGLRERYLPLKYYTHTKVHANKAKENKFAVRSCTYS